MEEFKAVMKDGVLKIKPNVTKDEKGNVTVHALDPATEAKAKNEILRKMALGEKVNIIMEEGEIGKRIV